MGDTASGSWTSRELGQHISRERAGRWIQPDKRSALEKLDRVILWLTYERLDAKTQTEWQMFLEASLIVRDARKEVACGQSS